MNNITIEQFETYKNVLKIEEITDIETLMLNYRMALLNYYRSDNHNIEQLKSIIEAFYCFSGFEMVDGNYEKLVNKYDELREREKNNESKQTISELIYKISMLITEKLLRNANELEKNELSKICETLKTLFSTVESIDRYEKTKNEFQKIKSIG